MTRTCEMYALSDCQTANGIKYCYCNTDRCNKIEKSTVESRNNHPISDNTDIISDDEDDSEYGDDDRIEASGSGLLITTTTTTTLSTSTTTSTLLQSLTTKENTNPITFETTTRFITTMRTDDNNFLTTISPKMNYKSNSSPVTWSKVYLILGTFVMIIF